MFFFFESEIDAVDFRLGQLCEIMSVHHPVFAKNIGRKIIITKVPPNSRLVWAHDARPPTYRINKNGNRVTEYDPRCDETLYSFEQLRVLDQAETKELLGALRRAW